MVKLVAIAVMLINPSSHASHFFWLYSGRDLLPFHSPNSLRPNATPPSTWSSYWKTTYLGLCLGMSFNLQISIYFKLSLLYLFAMKFFFWGRGMGGEEKNLERRNSVLVGVSLRMLQMKKKMVWCKGTSQHQSNWIVHTPNALVSPGSDIFHCLWGNRVVSL